MVNVLTSRNVVHSSRGQMASHRQLLWGSCAVQLWKMMMEQKPSRHGRRIAFLQWATAHFNKSWVGETTNPSCGCPDPLT